MDEKLIVSFRRMGLNYITKIFKTEERISTLFKKKKQTMEEIIQLVKQRENKNNPKYVIVNEFQGLSEKQLVELWKTFKTLKK